MQFAICDPAVAENAMKEALWTRWLFPQKLGGSSGVAEHAMAPVAVKEAVARDVGPSTQECPAGVAARPSPSKDHRIARTSNLRPDPHAMGGKKKAFSLGPARARGAPGGTGR